MFAHLVEQKGDDDLEDSLLQVGHLITLFLVKNLIFLFIFIGSYNYKENYHYLGYYQLINLAKNISVIFMAHCFCAS